MFVGLILVVSVSAKKTDSTVDKSYSDIAKETKYELPTKEVLTKALQKIIDKTGKEAITEWMIKSVVIVHKDNKPVALMTYLFSYNDIPIQSWYQPLDGKYEITDAKTILDKDAVLLLSGLIFPDMLKEGYKGDCNVIALLVPKDKKKAKVKDPIKLVSEKEEFWLALSFVY